VKQNHEQSWNYLKHIYYNIRKEKISVKKAGKKYFDRNEVNKWVK